MVQALWDRTGSLPGRQLILFNWYPFRELILDGVLLVLFSLGAAVLVRLGSLRWSHRRSLLLWPPTWFGALWPVVLIALLPGNILASGEVLVLGIVLLVASAAIALAFFFIWKLVRSTSRRMSGRRQQMDRLPSASETLAAFVNDPAGRMIPWIMDDRPIKYPSRDLFEAHTFATRMAELITQHQLGRIGLIGPWGSGKTTVLHLVDYFLHDDSSFAKHYRERWRGDSGIQSCVSRLQPPRVLTCWVNAWGFTKESAAAVVLRQAVAELSRHIDCLCVRCLPQEYLSALKGVAPSWLQGTLVLTSGATPSQQLQRLHPLLEAINARLIIYIEDLDRNLENPDVVYNQNVRNSGQNVLTEIRNDLSVRPDGRLFLEIASLLDVMKDETRVSFVLAISRRST